MPKPMNKFLKFVLIAGGILAGLVILGMIGVAAYIHVKYPPEKMKSMATEKLSEILKHKVSVGNVAFNMLTGFKITDLKINNRAGWADKPMVIAKDISISYHLYELVMGYFAGQILLGEIRLDQPQILVERRGLDQFNFSDMMGDTPSAAAPAATAAPKAKGKTKAKPKAKKKAKRHAALQVPTEAPMASGFSFLDQAWAETAPGSGASKPSGSSLLVSVDSININHGKMTYLDETTSPAQKSELKDLNLKIKNISMVGGKTSFTLSTPFSYSNLNYQLAIDGKFRYYLASQSLKDLAIDGKVNDLGFKVSGAIQNMSSNFAPDLDGEASLNMLKFSGLVPKALSSMPDGLAIDGPAKVTFHLSGTDKTGLKLKGVADGADLAVHYKDLFVKQAKSTCKLEFTSEIGQGYYNLPTFHATFQDWELDGSFHYKNGSSYSCELHSKSLPLKGLSNVVPRWKKVTFAGGTSLNFSCSQALNNPKSFSMNGRADMKAISITLPQEPFLENLTGPILFKGAVISIPQATFKSFEGSGAIAESYNLNAKSHAFSLSLQNVNAQQAVNASVDASVTKDPQDYHDKLFGLMNFNYKGTVSGSTGAEMEKSAAGSGTYSIVNAKVKGYAFIKTINGLFKDKSEEFVFEKINGNLALKNQVVSYTANTTSKIGTLRVVGAVNFDGVYSPDMKVMCDVHKDYLDSDSVKGNLPAGIREKWDVSRAADDQGNVPVDFRFTGPAKKTPGLDCVDLNRMIKNITNSYAKDAQKAVQEKAQEVGQDLGNKLKGLFGK